MPTRVYGFDVWEARLRALPTQVEDTVTAVFTAWEARLESWMRANAPWEDRTGEARRQLDAFTTPSAAKVWLTVAHGVEYGVYLETLHQGRFAILWPALRMNWPLIQTDLCAALSQRTGLAWRAGLAA